MRSPSKLTLFSFKAQLNLRLSFLRTLLGAEAGVRGLQCRKGNVKPVSAIPAPRTAQPDSRQLSSRSQHGRHVAAAQLCLPEGTPRLHPTFAPSCRHRIGGADESYHYHCHLSRNSLCLQENRCPCHQTRIVSVGGNYATEKLIQVLCLQEQRKNLPSRADLDL